MWPYAAQYAVGLSKINSKRAGAYDHVDSVKNAIENVRVYDGKLRISGSTYAEAAAILRGKNVQIGISDSIFFVVRAV